jgi:hypothetical protein
MKADLPSATATGDSPPRGKAGHYARVCAEAIGDRKLKPTARHVLTALGLFAGPDGRAWPSIDKLASVMGGVDKRAIKRALRSLEERGYIISEYRPRRSTLYRLRGLDGVAKGGGAQAQNPPPPPGGFVAGTLNGNSHRAVVYSATHNNPKNNPLKQPSGTAQGFRGTSRQHKRELTPEDWKVVGALERLIRQPKGHCAAYVAERIDAATAAQHHHSLIHNPADRQLILDDFWRWHALTQTKGAGGEGRNGH